MFKRFSSTPFIPQTQKVIWVLFLISLPVTSFPVFPRAIGGNATVRPLAIYPLIGLFLFVTLPRLWRRPVPRQFTPLILFVLITLLSSSFALTRNIDEFLGVSSIERSIRSLITLVLGCVLYISVALAPRHREDLLFSLRWLYIGFGIALLWGTLQTVYVIKFSSAYFEVLNDLQSYISTRRLFDKRISGLAFEPNWFAEQIVILLLPWLFTAVSKGYSVFQRRFRRITVEFLLLVWAIYVLIFTLSRGGLGIMFILLILSIILHRPKIRTGVEVQARKLSFSNKLLRRLSLAGLLTIILGGLIFSVGSNSGYFSRLWRFWTEDSPANFWNYIAVGQRFIYWDTAFQMFDNYPLLGVGLGNYALYFDDMMQDQPLFQHPEILRLITPAEGRSQLITPKNLFMRFLAETGLAGAGVFAVFIFVILGNALVLWLSPDPEHTFWGKSGFLGLIAFLVVTFSTDSLANPNMWVLFGLITAASNIFSPEIKAAVQFHDGEAGSSGDINSRLNLPISTSEDAITP